MCHKELRLSQKKGVLVFPYLVASDEVIRMAPQMGTTAAPQAEGTEVVPQAQTGPALQARGIRVASQVGGSRVIPQVQGIGLAPQGAL